MERISPVRNRMLEFGTSGSVGGEGGNILVYPATCAPMRREKSKWEAPIRMRVPKRDAGAEQLVVGMRVL
jgi:hypothetical protein